MKPKVYNVEKYEHSIHLSPRSNPKDLAASKSSKPKRKSCKSDVFEWENGKIDIMFREQRKEKAPTLTLVAKFPFMTLLQSSTRFNLCFSLSKEEMKLFEREVIFSREYWVEAMAAAIESQKLGETPEQLQARIEEIKKKGDFV